VDRDLGEPGIADEPDHRTCRVVGGVAAVDGPLGEQGAALVDDVRTGGDDDDQLAAGPTPAATVSASGRSRLSGASSP
jgi:hypothetical protein